MNEEPEAQEIHGTVVGSGRFPGPAADQDEVGTPEDQEDQEEERPGTTDPGYGRAPADRGDGDEVIDADAVIIEEVDEVPAGDEPPANDEAPADDEAPEPADDGEAPEPVAGFARTPVASPESATAAASEADTSAEDAEAAAAVDHDAAEAATVPETDVIAEAVRPGVPRHASMPSGAESPAGAGVADDPGHLHEQWLAIQSAFVDDPHASVAAAAELVSETIAALVAGVQERERGLRGEWERDGADTEDLRNTLRGYRRLLDQVAAR
jgi:hypothetical protein